MSQTQSEKSPVLSDKESDSEEFDVKEKKQTKKSKSKRTNQSASKQVKQEPQKKQKKKGGKKKQQKQQKSKKQAGPKRKPKSKKDGGKDAQQNKSKVLQYMQKQNRPYNLLNVFDNLHGKIKKADLQTILNELAQESELKCKQFGKNKVYFLNQDKFDLNMKEVEDLSSTYTKLKEEQQVLKEENKRLNDQYRKLMARKTLEELDLDSFDLSIQISKLKKKKEYLVGEDIQKVDEEQVKAIEKESSQLDKELNKRRKLLKQCLGIWSEITEKKVPEIAQMMGIQLV